MRQNEQFVHERINVILRISCCKDSCLCVCVCVRERERELSLETILSYK